MDNKALNQSSEKAGYGEVFAYGMGGFGRGILNSVIMGLLNYFYTNSIGMSAASVGIIFMVSRIFDGVSDIGAGCLVDRCRSKYGKCRSWILKTSVLFGISTFILFTVPNISTTGRIIYVAITYNLATSVLGTLFYVPHMTLVARMTRDQRERTTITIVNQILTMLSMLVATMLMLPLIQQMGNTQEAWIKVNAVVCPIAVVAMLICFYFTRERVQEAEAIEKNEQKKEKLGAKKVIMVLFSNKYWWMILGIFVFDALGNNFFGAVQLYYMQYILGDVTYASTISLINTIGLLFALFAAPIILRKIDKRNVFLLGAVMKLIGLILMIILPVNVTTMCISRLIEGVGRGLNYATMYAFVPDTMEYGQWKTGVRLEGIVQSCCSIGAKFGVGVGPGIAGILMSLGQYDGLLAVQPDSAINMIKFCAIWAPIIFTFIMLLIILAYDLDKRYPQIMKDLEERKKAMQQAV